MYRAHGRVRIRADWRATLTSNQATGDQSRRTGSSDNRQRATWHYTPSLPVEVSPYFKWPPELSRIVSWICGGWFPVSERLVILALAIVSSLFFQPSLSQTTEFSLAWIATIYARNFFLMFLIAGGLHWYFYTARKQGDERRYDSRPFATSSRVFTFGSQVRDNMFWTLASGVTIWTAYESLMLWALANGYATCLECA